MFRRLINSVYRLIPQYRAPAADGLAFTCSALQENPKSARGYIWTVGHWTPSQLPENQAWHHSPTCFGLHQQKPKWKAEGKHSTRSQRDLVKKRDNNSSSSTSAFYKQYTGRGCIFLSFLPWFKAIFSFFFFFFPLNKIVNYWKRGSPCEIGSQGLGNVSNHRFLSDLSKTASYANSSHSKTAILWLSLHCFSYAHQEVRLVLRPNDRAETETQLLHSHVFPLNWSIRA